MGNDSIAKLLADTTGLLVGALPGVLFTIWKPVVATGAHVTAAVDAVVAHVGQAEQGRGKWAVLVGISAHVPLPGEDVREAVQREMRRLDPYLFCGATVIERAGLGGVAQRSVVSTLQLLTRPKHPEKVFADCDQAAEFIAEEAKRRELPPLDERKLVRAYLELSRRASA